MKYARDYDPSASPPGLEELYAGEFSDHARVCGLLSPAELHMWGAMRAAALGEVSRRREAAVVSEQLEPRRRGPSVARLARRAAA